MPIEIKELVIRAVVSPPHGGGGGGGGGGCSSGKAESTGGGQDFDAIVQASVDETLCILRRQRER